MTAKAKPYHHGDLPAALLAAAETLLRRDGIAGLGLRAIAREAGVSHAAAKPHFGDIAGLLGELAAVGYDRLADALRAAGARAATPRARNLAIAHAYVAFAREHQALFALMFRGELIDMTRPRLQAATGNALRALASALGGEPATRAQAIEMTAGWAYVHGLATLLVDGRLRGIIRVTDAFADPDALVDAVLDATRVSADTRRARNRAGASTDTAASAPKRHRAPRSATA